MACFIPRRAPRRFTCSVRSKTSSSIPTMSRVALDDPGVGRVVVQAVQGPEAVDGRLHHGAHGVLRRDVGLLGDGLPAGRLDLGDRLLGAVGVHVGDDHRRALRGQALAVARPIPEPEPVTMATLPSSSPIRCLHVVRPVDLRASQPQRHVASIRAWLSSGCPVPGLRRRPPLLRGARRLHAPHAQAARQAGHAVGRARRQSTACSWAGRSTASSRTPRSTRWPGPAASTVSSRARTRRARRPRHHVRGAGAHPRRYRDREIRLRVPRRQGVEAAFLFPTLGVGMEEALKDDPEALPRRLPRLQPVARRGLGLRLRGPALRHAR